MHYFDIVLPFFLNEEDRSYPHPALSLAWRLDDLTDRLALLARTGAPRRNGDRLTADDIRYALAKDLHTLRDVEKAIAFAKEDMQDLYGITVDDVQEAPARDAIKRPAYEQLTLYGHDTREHPSKAQGAA